MGMPDKTPAQKNVLNAPDDDDDEYKKELARRNKLAKTPDDPQSVIAKTRARKKAAREAQLRKGRASTILTDDIG